MAMKGIKEKLTVLLKKYRYVAMVLLIGLALMLIPDRTNTQKGSEVESPSEIECEVQQSADETLAQILSKISGAGNVQVMLTCSSGEETVYQTDNQTTVSADASSTQIDTVVISTADRAQSGLIRQINPPTYLGAIVVCQGADDPSVRLAIVDAVSKVTGLGADRISVLKMK